MSVINSPQDKKVIGLIGEKGSGKGSVAKLLMEKYGAQHFGTSVILKKIADEVHLPQTRDNLIKLALVLKDGFWPGIVIDAMISEIEKSGSALVIADGIRMHGDVEPFWDKYGENFKLVYVTAPLNIRFERTRLRKEKVGEENTDFRQFIEEEGRLTEVSIAEIGKMADYKIDNSGSLPELEKQIIDIMDKIL